MRVDFYLLSQDSVETALARIARASLKADQRLLVVCAEGDLLASMDQALWEEFPQEFLAHGTANAPNATRQPILLSAECAPLNDARYLAIADGRWRDEALGFERVFLFFDEVTRSGARDCWKMLGEKPEVERHFWRQEEGRWIEQG